jgi:N-acetylneuraminic acid mutarotase
MGSLRRKPVRRAVSFVLIFLGLGSVWAPAAGGLSAPAVAQQLSVSERIACHTAVEEVYWSHRQWPEKAAKTRPSFSQTVPASLLQAKAEDSVRKSLALERYWDLTITGAMLQAELDRMAAASKSPAVFGELLAALGNDPYLAAECLARPLLADRLIRSNYSRDERFHGDLERRARGELANAAPASMKRMSGQYSELEWRRGRDAATGSGTTWLDERTFDERIRGLRASLANGSGELPIGRVGSLREDETRFYAVVVLEEAPDRVRLGAVEWRKTTFDSWWASTRTRLATQLDSSSEAFTLPEIASGGVCRDDSWKPTAQVLDPRYWHTAVWTGTEMIVFGGFSSVGTIYADGGRYDPATDTWTLVASLGAPSARQSHVAVWTGREMVVWGGTGDKTGGRYDPVTDTWKKTSTAGAPSPRQNATVVWTGKEMIVWGGSYLGTLNTGGRYNPTTNTWAALPTPTLAPRAYHSAVWTGKEMVVWGGYDGFIGQIYGDGSRYNPSTNTWKPVSHAGDPNDRFYHTAVWTGSEMIVWGGINSPRYDLSGGRYNPATNAWTPTSLDNAPSLRWLHAAVWTGTEMVVQGGTPVNATGGRYNPATDTWTPTNPLNAATNGQGITVVWTGTEMIVWGGLDGDFVFRNDGGRYNPTSDSWVRTGTTNVPSARGLHSAVWTGSEMMVWGGFTGLFTNTGGLYDPATDSWRTATTVGAPKGRENAEAVWTGTEAIFWGGDPDGDGSASGSGGSYDVAADRWELTTKENAPTNRYGHTAVWTGQEMIVFGGVGTNKVAKLYDPSTNTWRSATKVNAPGERDHHGAVWTGTEMVIWGGFINAGSTPTGGRYNPATDTWRPTNVDTSPKRRMWPISVWTGTEAIFWGGHDHILNQDLNDGGRYDPVTDTWTETTLRGAPSPRIGQGVWTGTELVLWGGVFDSSGGRYDPESDSWRPTTLVNAPFVRGGGRWTTVWTGSQMIIWGGIIETQEGSLYCASGAANVAPVAGDDAYEATMNRTLVVGNMAGVLANDADANGDLLTASVVAKPTHGTLSLNDNGSFIYKPAAGYVGPDSFIYRAFDGVARSNRATVSIEVS